MGRSTVRRWVEARLVDQPYPSRVRERGEVVGLLPATLIQTILEVSMPRHILDIMRRGIAYGCIIWLLLIVVGLPVGR